MNQQELMALAGVRFASGSQVFFTDPSGRVCRGSVHGVVSGIFNYTPCLGLMIWLSGSLTPNAYELSWALDHMQVIG